MLLVLLSVTFRDNVGEYNGRRRWRRRGLLHGSESDILRTPHEGKPLGPAQPTVGMISTFPFSNPPEDQRLPSAYTAHIQTGLNGSDKPVS